MRTIDETIKEINANGYGNLEAEEIETYMKWREEIAARDAEHSATVKATQEALQAIADAQQSMADAAIKKYDEVMAAQFTPAALEF